MKLPISPLKKCGVLCHEHVTHLWCRGVNKREGHVGSPDHQGRLVRPVWFDVESAVGDRRLEVMYRLNSSRSGGGATRSSSEDGTLEVHQRPKNTVKTIHCESQ